MKIWRREYGQVTNYDELISHIEEMGETEKNKHDVWHVIHQLETRFNSADWKKVKSGGELEERRKTDQN